MEKEEEARSNSIQENCVKWYKSSSIRASQNALQDNTDRISRLPDSLLLHMLSHLGIEEVTKTNLLSKRWRYLWTSIPCLDFRSLGCGRRIEKTTFIDRFLFYHDESKVDKLHIQIEYEEKHDQLVDTWIHFAIRHKVVELRLDFFDGEFPEGSSSDYTLYKLPHSLFRCWWLTKLILCGCDLNLPATIQFNSLKTLFFGSIDLDPKNVPPSPLVLSSSIFALFLYTLCKSLHVCNSNFQLSDEVVKEYDFEEKQLWKLRELDSSSILQNIKSIKIKGYHSTIPIKDVRRWEREIELVRFLLKTSQVLERMTIKTCISIRNNMDLMFEVTQKLTSFPRTSPNAGLFIS